MISGGHGDADTTALARLARMHGVRTEHHSDTGELITAAPDVLVEVLAALGVDASTPAAVSSALRAWRDRHASRLLPSFIAVRAGREDDVTEAWRDPVARDAGREDAFWDELRVDLEDGDTVELSNAGNGHHAGDGDHAGRRSGELPRALAHLPIGRHRLIATVGTRSDAAPLLVAPRRLAPICGRDWGIVTQLYATLSRTSWGMGDLGDLQTLVSWAGRQLGAGFVQLNPLHPHAAGPDGRPAATPYKPSSRRFRDPMNIRVEAVAEYALLTAADRRDVDDLAARGRALGRAVLRDGALIDRGAVWDLKRAALELIYRVPRGERRRRAFEGFRSARGADIEEYATWCALADRHGPNWREWPVALRDPRSAAVARARDELSDLIAFHAWLAWIVEDQLATVRATAREAGMSIGVIHDLAVGLHPNGADAWSAQDILATGLRIGCPPDRFNQRGQDWGMPPWRPTALADAEYRPFAEILRGSLRDAGGLRLDHVMGLFRMWCIPAGRPPAQGAYVRYDHRALLAVLTLEAHRAGAVVIGEDLGTVEPIVREELAERGILGTSVLLLASASKVVPASSRDQAPLAARRRRQCLATLTTHDLPSTASWLTGDHLRLRDSLRLLVRSLDEETAVAAANLNTWVAELVRTGLLPTGSTAESIASDAGLPLAIAAFHDFLIRHTPARLIGLWLPDALGDRRQPNVPGTRNEYPNWCLPLADSTGQPAELERVLRSPSLREFAGAFTRYFDPPTPSAAGGPSSTGTTTISAELDISPIKLRKVG